MLIKDFFQLILKLFGLYFIVAVIFTVIPALLMSVQQVEFFTLLGVVLMIILLAAVFLLLIFKADVVIRILRLEKGFESPVLPLDNIDTYSVLKIGCVLVGGFLFVDNLAPMVSNGYQLLKGSLDRHFEETLFGRPNTQQDFALNSLNLLIGYLLVTNSHRFARWLNQDQSSNQ